MFSLKKVTIMIIVIFFFEMLLYIFISDNAIAINTWVVNYALDSCDVLLVYSSSKCHSLSGVKSRNRMLKDAYLYAVGVSNQIFLLIK